MTIDLSRPATAPRPVELAGPRVAVRPVDPDADVADLFAGSHGSEEREALWRYMGYGPFSGVDAMRSWLERCAGSEDPRFRVVHDLASGRRVGVVSFLNIRPEMRVLEIGHIWYVPEAQRTHVNTETVFVLLREAFDVLGYRRVEWKCDALNERSRRAALRLGFTFEGVFRQHMIVRGRNRDTAWFALLDGEWPRVRSNFERYGDAPAGTLSLGDLNRTAP